MGGRIRILILQEEGEAELLEYELSKFKVPFAAVRVESLEAYLKSLREFSPDLIFAGSQPTIDRRTALALAQEECPEVPFIFLAGTRSKDIGSCLCSKVAAEYSMATGVNTYKVIDETSALTEAAETIPATGDDHFGALLQTVSSMVAFLSPECRILEFSRGAERLTGWCRNEVLGKDALELLVPEDDRSQARAKLDQVLSGTASKRFDLAIRLRNGTERSLALTCDLLSDHGGHPAAIMLVGQEVAEQQRQPYRALTRMVSAGRNRTLKHRVLVRRTGSC